MGVKNKVIYTCITGGYDKLLSHTFISSDWDYICFSDNIDIRNEKNAEWIIRPLCFDKLDNVRNQRWHKIHPHLLLPEYEVCLWVDGNVDILNNKIFSDIEKAMENKCLISCALHPERTCIYDEFEACRERNKDDSEIMNKQEYLIKKDGFPRKMGLFETCVTFRKHSHPLVIKIMHEWWFWVEQYSRRDQLSLTYVLWKNKYKIDPLSSVSYRYSSNIKFRYESSHVTIEELMKQKEELEAELKRFKNSIYWRAIKPFHKIKKSLIKRFSRLKRNFNSVHKRTYF